MPPAIITVAAYAAAAYFEYISIAAAVIGILSSVAMPLFQAALAPKPKGAAAAPSFSAVAQNRTLTITEPAGEAHVYYGVVRVGGYRTFLHTTGASKEFLHMVATHAQNRCAAVRAVLLDNEVVPLDSSGDARGKYAGFVTAVSGLGTVDGDARFQAALQAACPDKWTARHRQTGRPKTYLRLKYDRDKFPGALPNPSVIAWTCDEIADPRDASTGFTDNWALCVANYLRRPELECGLGATDGEIDQDDLIASANISDEMAPRKKMSVAFQVHPALDSDATPDSDSAAAADTIAILKGTTIAGDSLAALISLSQGAPIGDMTDGGGLAAAFDGITADAPPVAGGYLHTAYKAANITVGYVGKDWGLGVTRTVRLVRAFAPAVQGFTAFGGNELITLTLLGSTVNDPSTATALGSCDPTPNAPALALTIDTIDDSTAYRYHWLRVAKESASDGPLCTEALFYSAAVAAPDNAEALRLGTRVTVASSVAADSDAAPDSDGLPDGLTDDTEYFWMPFAPGQGQLASSLANARAGIGIVLGSTGSGMLSLTVDAEPRYTLNGGFESSETPQDILTKMALAGAGAIVFAGGKWHIHAGAWRPIATDAAGDPIVLGKGDLDGPISAQTQRSRRDLFNGVKGVFANPDLLYQPTDYPPLQRAAYKTADLDQDFFRDQPLDFTNSPSACQRIASILLERNRRQITTSWPCNLTALRVQAMSTIGLDNDLWGWAGKTFECGNFGFAQRGGTTADDPPRFGIDLALSEIDAAVFAWDETVDETTLVPAAPTNLPNPANVAPPTGLVLASGTAELYRRLDGTIFSRIKAAWTSPADIFVVSGGQIEIQYRKSIEATYRHHAFVDGAIAETFILDVQDGQAYDVRIRSRNGLGVASIDWVEVTGHVVIGKTSPPADVTGFSVQRFGGVSTFRWNQVPDGDLAGYELRYMAAPFSWDDANVITSVTRGTLITNTGLIPGTWTVGVKAIDTTGNYSANAATFEVVIINPNTVIFTDDEAPDWRGTRDGFVWHMSGKLVPADQNLAGDYGWETFDSFVPTPVASCSYTSAEIDTGFDDELRLLLTQSHDLGPGVTGVPVLDLSDEVWLTGESEPGVFSPWEPTVQDLRYVRGRITETPGATPVSLTEFSIQIDRAPKIETASTVAVDPGGSIVVFPEPFHTAPNVQITATDSSATSAVARNITTTQFEAHVLTGSTDTGGSANYTATGA